MKITKQQWATLEPPKKNSNITVAEVLTARSGLHKHSMIKNWARAVWESWSHYHQSIREKTAELI
jgi:hypothetical protein